MRPSRPPRLRVLRIIARLNVGGPALHVSILSGRLDPTRYDTLLLSGSLGPGEALFDRPTERYGARINYVDGLGPELSAGTDGRALRSLVKVMREFRPHIVHTHTAKAGTLGRIAARLALGPRPIVVHTYHGHVLSGYFGPTKTRLFRDIERVLALTTDRLIGVSQATVDELVRMGVAPAKRFAVIPIGLDLAPFLTSQAADGLAFRDELGWTPGDVLALFVGRLVPIKRVDVLLEAVAISRRDGARIRLAVVGDGPLRSALEAHRDALGIGGAVTFCGFRTDLPVITPAADIAVLSSDNEGTPVALIEAAACARPSVATDVGGVGDIVGPESGVLVPAGNPQVMARALTALAGDRGLRERMGTAARTRVATKFSADRLLGDVDDLYQALLARTLLRGER